MATTRSAPKTATPADLAAAQETAAAAGRDAVDALTAEQLAAAKSAKPAETRSEK